MSDDHDDRVEEPRIHPVSRRAFLKGSSAALAGGAAVATIGPARVLAQDATPEATPAMPGMNMTGAASAAAPVKFFTDAEAKTVDAIVSRIMPGTADDPGAHEAGVVIYIDNQLFGTNLGYDLKTYQQGPFLVMSDQTLPVESSSAEDIYHTVPIVTDQAGRYGFQSSMGPQEMYRRGLGFVDAYAQSKFKKNFVDLAPDQQDSILTDMAADKATGFNGPSAKAFFGQLRNDTIEGMFSDPMYGGNQGMVGWKLVGFPGAQHRYTPDDMHNASFSVAPMSLAQMINGQ
jgi:gluconate 2-dehydrogenase gamma chain